HRADDGRCYQMDDRAAEANAGCLEPVAEVRGGANDRAEEKLHTPERCTTPGCCRLEEEHERVHTGCDRALDRTHAPLERPPDGGGCRRTQALDPASKVGKTHTEHADARCDDADGLTARIGDSTGDGPGDG